MLHKALKAVREFHNMRQSDLASEIGVSNSYLSEIESGKKQPTLDLIERYSSYFDIPASSLLFFSENMDNVSSASSRFKSGLAKRILTIMQWVSDINDVKNSKKA